VLGAVEVDAEGSVNVSSFPGCFAGVGGFVNISQSARRVVFCCTFTAGDLAVEMEAGKLRIVREGKHRKFVRRLPQISFHGPTALASGQQVLYVTERAVFELTAGGLRLLEIAEGIDLATQILPLMDFQPIIEKPRAMPAHCFEVIGNQFGGE
jgi:propionate CoA-transferase